MKKIMFNDKMCLTQAVIEGRKTQTRRIIKNKNMIARHWNPAFNADRCYYTDERGKCQLIDADTNKIIVPSYQIGEVVAVAQSYKDAGFRPNKILYRSIPKIDGYKQEAAASQKGWSNKMFVAANLMPHQIRITDVRIERLQDITDECCLKEGVIKWDAGQKDIPFFCYPNSAKCDYDTPQEAFAYLINKVSGKDVWEENPYVFVYDFELVNSHSLR